MPAVAQETGEEFDDEPQLISEHGFAWSSKFWPDKGIPRNKLVVKEKTVYNFTHYTIDNGLASNDILAMHMDHDGKLWIGTDEGLNTFDGYEFRSFISDPDDSTTICGRIVSDVKEATERYIFLALADGGVSVYDRYYDNFTSDHNKLVMEAMGMDSWDNQCSAVCPVPDGMFSAHNGRFVKYYPEDDHIDLAVEHRRRSVNKMLATRIKMVAMPNNERIVFSLLDNHTILMLDDLFKIFKTINFPARTVNDICPIDENNLFLATSHGLFVYNIKKKILVQEARLRTIQKVQAIGNPGDGTFWIAYGDNQIANWNPKNNNLTVIANTSDFFGRQTKVTEFLFDKSGLIWLGTNNSGIVKFDPKPSKIQSILLEDEDFSGSTHDIFVRNHHEIWLALGSGGILKLDAINKKKTRYAVNDQSVLSVYVRRNGEMFLGTTSGLFRYDLKTQVATQIPWPPHIDVDADVNEIIEDCLGNLWIAAQDGVYKYNGVEMVRILDPGSNYEVFNCVYEDNDGNMWVGAKSGVFRREANDSIFSRIGVSQINSGLGCNTYCFEDAGDEVYIGTTSGTVVYEKKTKKVYLAEFNQFYGSTAVYSIVHDKNNNTWLSLNNTLACYENDTKNPHIFGVSDGLIYGGKESHVLIQYGDTIYFGHANNINFIDVNKIRASNYSPVPYISDIRYGKPGEEITPIMENDSCYLVSFSFNSNLLISLGSSDMTVPQRNEFYYKIDGGEVQELKNSNVIAVSDLFTGVHKIEIKTVNADRIISADPLTIYVNLKPQIWLNKSAIILYIILLVTIGWVLINARFRDINKKLRQVEGEVRAKKIVEAQRNKLAKIHKEQTDSINYAKRIQDAIMPLESMVHPYFEKIFVFFKPKNIVSGDFYCFYHRDDKTFIVAGDCTGHGVPGAFISILGIDHLYNIIMKLHTDDAGDILTMLNKELHETIFKSKVRNDEFNEGMDVTISVVDHKNQIINFAGAMNNLFVIRDNEIITYRGDRNPIGTNTDIAGESGEETQFSSQFINCMPGDMFYMFSDGFVDQFGGPEQKKFKNRRFKHLLLNIHELPARDQKQILNQKLDEWRGSNEQTDDVIVVGFEPWKK